MKIAFSLSKCALIHYFMLQVQDISPQQEPHKTHYFLAGVGLTHMIVCTFFTLAIVLIRYAITGTNIFEVRMSF